MSSLPSQRSDTAESTKKRRKGATRLSCAECRRLKLRCDRVIPCSSCVKRGCGAICPDGSLTTGQGNRFVLASTTELHEKILQLANRVRSLEDGLRSSHSQLSQDPHPLLSEDLLAIKAPLQREPPTSRHVSTGNIKEEMEEPNPALVDAFGSLSMSETGSTNYYGHIAGSMYFWQNEYPEADRESEFSQLQMLLSPDILMKAASFPIAQNPLTDKTRHEQLQSLYWYLPSSDQAMELRNIYFRNAAWMYNPISPQAFDEQIYYPFYSGPPPDDGPLVCHRLSILFMVLALGSLMNTELPPYNLEAEKFHQLARAALFQHSLLDDPTTNAVQALFLISFYLFFCDRHGSQSGARWTIMGLTVKIAQSIGLRKYIFLRLQLRGLWFMMPLDRDNSRWNLDPIETQRRRELFWELYTYDSWQCMTFGRPPAFNLAHMDCRMPYSSDPGDEHSYHAWKHRFTAQCMNALHDEAFGAKLPTYATILQLDRKMRNYPVPPVLQIAGFGNSESRPGGYPETIPLIMQRHIVLAIRETNLVYLHRSFFAKAISDHPKDPLGSPYGSSVIAAYRSAGSLVALMRNLHAQLPELSSRIFFLYAHLFSCAIILGSIVCRCPSMSLAPSALVQLDSACELFGQAARGFRAEKILNIMLGLKDKAHSSLSAFRLLQNSPPRQGQGSEPPTPLDDNDELATLGGKTRLVAKKDSSNPPSPAHAEKSPTSLNPVVPLPLSPQSDEHVHPNVVEYLRYFSKDGTQYNTTAYQGSSAYSPSSQSYDREPPKFESQSTHTQPLNLQPSAQAGTSQAMPSFPTYFSVYDYASEDSMQVENGQDSSQVDGTGGRRTTLEANMQSTWSDFVSSNFGLT